MIAALVLLALAAILQTLPRARCTRHRISGLRGDPSAASRAPGSRPATRDAGRLTSARFRALAAASVGLVPVLALGGVAGPLAGAVASGVAWRWLGGQEARHERARRMRLEADLPHAVDLFVALLRAGRAPTAAAEAVGAVVAGPAGEVMAGVARRDRAGLDAYAVWRPLTDSEGTRVLGGAMLRSLDSGARVVDIGDRVAEELRRDLRAAASAHARTIGVRATAPLAACFLPALVLIGVVPFVASLVIPLLGGL